MEPQKGIDIADFPTIFQSLTSGRRTGTLKVSTDTGALFFYFRDGVIRLFAQPARDDVLLRAMLRSSKIDRAEYDKLLSRHQRTGRSYSLLFSAKRKITDSDVREALQFMVQEEVCDLFTQPRLLCEFFEGEPFEEIFGKEKGRVELSVMPEFVVMEAARRMDEISVLRATVPSTSDVYTTTGVTVEQPEAPIPPEDTSSREEVLDLIDGRRDLNEIAELVRMSKFDLVHTIAQLVNARIIEALGARSLLTLAQQYAIEGNVRKALRLYARAEELGENGMETRMHIARLYGALCDQKHAVAKYLSIAEDAIASNDTGSAVAALRQALQVDPENIAVREKLAASLLQSDRYDETINESIELANLLLKVQNLDGAVRVWQSFLDKYPTSTESHRQLAELYTEQDNKTAAIQTLENLAELYLARARRDRAAEVYREILALDPRHTRVRLKLASVLRRIGNIKEAAHEYEQFRSSTRLLRFSERPQTALKLWFGLRHPAVVASARLALNRPVMQTTVILITALVLAGILTLAFSLAVSSQEPGISSRIGSALFTAMLVLQAVILFGLLPPLSSASVLSHPHEEDTSIAAQLAVHPRGAVAGKFVTTFVLWLVLLFFTLPVAITVVLLDGASASAVSLSFYMQILLGAVTAAALTLVSANVPDRKFAVIDSYLACTLLVLIGMLFIGMLSEASGTGGARLMTPLCASDVPRFQAETLTFVGTALLMPLAVIFISGMMLIGAVARLSPERGYSGTSQKLFWLVVILLSTLAGLAWATTGAKASSLSQPPVAQLLLLMSVFLALSMGAVLFPTESARGSIQDQERFKQLFLKSRLTWILRPGPMHGSLFTIAGCALVMLVIFLFLSLAASSAILPGLGSGTTIALYFGMLGHLAVLVSLGFLLSTTSLSNRWRRLIQVCVLGVFVAVIPAVIKYLQIRLPHVISDLSPLVLAAAAFGKGLASESLSCSADTISWWRAVIIYWLAAAAMASVAFLRLRNSTKNPAGGGGKTR